MRRLLFGIMLLLLTPLMVLGFPFYMLPILAQRGKSSGTAYEPFNGRLLYHLCDKRPDEAAMQLAGGLPATNRVVMALIIRPITWAVRVSGYTPLMLEYPPPRPTPMSAMVGARCQFIDDALLKHTQPGDQVVILGAGWDTRAYGLLGEKQLHLYEVDTPATQVIKQRALDKTTINTSAVTFVSCDFNQLGWLQALKQQGFDPGKRTFILWEGVTMYLDEAAVQSTLRALANLPTGSRIVFDCFSREWLQNTLPGKLGRLGVAWIYGEPFKFGIPAQPDFEMGLRDYLQQHGLELESHWIMGSGRANEVPFGGLALVVNPG